MENIVLYSHHLDFDQVVELVKTYLPKAKVEVQDGGMQKAMTATIKGGLFSKPKSLKINYRQRKNPSYQLTEIECGLTKNLAGMSNFIQSIPTENKTVQQQLLIKVQSLNCEMPFIGEPEITPEFKVVLQEILLALDGIVFTQPSKNFDQSTGQHFLDKNLNLILDTAGQSRIKELEVKVNAKYHDQPAEEVSANQQKRKAQSEAFLQAAGIKINPHLPCTPDDQEVQLRDASAIIERAYALMIIAVKGEGIEPEHLERAIADKQVKGFSPKEEYILKTSELDDQERAYATWRYESLNLLLWALGKLEVLNPATSICDVSNVVGAIFKPDKASFTSTVQLRSKAEILDELDKTYRMHWACVDARINGQPVSGDLNPSVIYERHYALNWLTHFQQQDWDDIQMPT